MSLVLVFIVIIFLLCNSLKTCLNLYELSMTLKGKVCFENLYRKKVNTGKDLKEEMDKDWLFRDLSIISNVLISAGRLLCPWCWFLLS